MCLIIMRFLLSVFMSTRMVFHIFMKTNSLMWEMQCKDRFYISLTCFSQIIQPPSEVPIIITLRIELFFSHNWVNPKISQALLKRYHCSKNCSSRRRWQRTRRTLSTSLSMDTSGIHHFRHRSAHRTPTESRQEYLTCGEEYIEPRKTQ